MKLLINFIFLFIINFISGQELKISSVAIDKPLELAPHIFFTNKNLDSTVVSQKKYIKEEIFLNKKEINFSDDKESFKNSNDNITTEIKLTEKLLESVEVIVIFHDKFID